MAAARDASGPRRGGDGPGDGAGGGHRLVWQSRAGNRARHGAARRCDDRARAHGRELVQRGWIVGEFQPDQELAIVRKDGGLLTPDIDRQRLASLISRDEATAAERELSRVEDDVQALGRARLAFRSSRAAGERLAAALPASLANDPDLLFDRARAARRAGDNAAAGKLLQRGVFKAFAAAHPARWWTEANLVARALVA